MQGWQRKRTARACVSGARHLRDQDQWRLPRLQARRPHDGLALGTLERDEHLGEHLQHDHLLVTVADDVGALVPSKYIPFLCRS
eukprot:7376393-Prymnesium_polylepis.1